MSVAVVYHSNFGHTQVVAQCILEGVKAKQVECHLVDVLELTQDSELWELLDQAKVLVFGSPTYMGSVSAEFKAFMDQTSSRWFSRSWQGKWSAGFTVSGSLSGDKLQVLQQLCLFSMQHGMNWSGLPHMCEGALPEHVNRLGSHLGLMAQADDADPKDSPPSGDRKTARLFGEHVAGLLKADQSTTDQKQQGHSA